MCAEMLDKQTSIVAYNTFSPNLTNRYDYRTCVSLGIQASILFPLEFLVAC